MIDQEVYDLSQTGDEVQGILNKSEALPTNPELQQALAGKQDVIPDLNAIRQNAQNGQVAYQRIPALEQAAENAAQSAADAANDADVAKAQALAAAGKLEELETF
jgi:hypothetical protein